MKTEGANTLFWRIVVTLQYFFQTHVSKTVLALKYILWPCKRNMLETQRELCSHVHVHNRKFITMSVKLVKIFDKLYTCKWGHPASSVGSSSSGSYSAPAGFVDGGSERKTLMAN